MIRGFSSFIVCVIVIAIAGHSPELIAKDLANLPPEVVNGWRSLAKASNTYRIMISALDADGNHQYNPGVLSRLNNRYAKYERLGAGSPSEDWSKEITEVVLYDGEEYFTIDKAQPDAGYKLQGAGNNRNAYLVLSVGAPPSTSVFVVDFLQAIDSTTETFTKFERRDGQNAGIYVTLESSNSPRASGAFEIIAKLDPDHDYRVASAIQTSGASVHRSRIEYRYGEHPALPSEELHYSEIRDRATGDWVAVNPEKPYVTRRQLLNDVNLIPAQFTLEHYGLPPFRKRHRSIWPTIAIIAGAVVVVGGVFYGWRRYAAN